MASAAGNAGSATAATMGLAKPLSITVESVDQPAEDSSIPFLPRIRRRAGVRLRGTLDHAQLAADVGHQPLLLGRDGRRVRLDGGDVIVDPRARFSARIHLVLGGELARLIDEFPPVERRGLKGILRGHAGVSRGACDADVASISERAQTESYR